jgi:hypothetical protein
MKKVFLFFILSICLSKFSFSQNSLACDGERYIDDVFSNFTVSTVTYGSNTTIFGFSQDLEMDIYEPVGDVHEQRPVIIFAFGEVLFLVTNQLCHITVSNLLKKDM